MPSQTGGQCPLFGGSFDSSLEGSLDPLSGGCMNSNVDSTGTPCVCTLSGELGLAECSFLRSEFPLEAFQFLLPPSAWGWGEDAGTSALPPATATGGYAGPQ